MSRFATLSIVLLAGLLTIDVSAQGRGRGRSNAGGNSGATDVSVSATFAFGDSDRTAFRSYFARHRVTAQPLPPGIAKNVVKGKPLPPGIAKKALPADLLLLVTPRAGRDVSFAIVSDVVVATRGGVVVDLMVGLFR